LRTPRKVEQKRKRAIVAVERLRELQHLRAAVLVEGRYEPYDAKQAVVGRIV